MNTRPAKSRASHLRRLPSAPTAFVLGTEDEILAYEPVLQRASLAPVVHKIDPVTLDVETVMLDEDLAALIETAAMAIIGADVSGDDRLPLISFIDESLPSDRLILASCSQAGVNEQAAICQHAERLVGFGPLGLLSNQRIVEIAAGFATHAAHLDQAVSLFETAGIETHRVEDSPGLVLGRILMPIVNEAVVALTEGVASAEDIDGAMRLGANYPFGPLHWADELGLDRVLLAMEYLVQATHEERYRPAPLLRRMAQAGLTGKAAGRGFFTYGPAEA